MLIIVEYYLLKLVYLPFKKKVYTPLMGQVQNIGLVYLPFKEKVSTPY